ncbi:hypothetical protein AAV79_004842 [Salmonella enterica subsp. enterica serovar Mbandaka]|nr:hypothetical protein [Salmonella enterica subsp. enterica serovar Mbandaka]EED9866619.1 hypothetical protein [Salmonella enterica subsp. enterica serovar Mbandaka]
MRPLRVSVSIGELEITGEMLTIRTITADELYLEGKIQHVRYHRPRQCLTRRSENADMNACSRAQP